MQQPLRVVIDPNVWISAIITPGGVPAQVVQAVIEDHLIAVVTQGLLDELATVLFRPRFRRWISIADTVAFIETLTGKADLRPDPGPSPYQSRDPNDDYLIALAYATDALLVSGDADLLQPDLPLLVLTPRALLDHLNQQP